MEVLVAVLLGMIQGLTEFLPISSSAHLILVPWLVGWEPGDLVFDVALHLGTSVAILAYFWRDWIGLVREILLGISERNLFGNADRRLAWFIIVGTLPAGFAGLALENYVQSHLRSPLITVVTLLIFGGVLYYAERRGKQSRSLDQFSWGDCIWIGLSQAVALIPGVSRSGITISAAMLRNVDRTSAARFSFLLSTPVIVGAGILEGWRFVETSFQPATGFSGNVSNSMGTGWAVLAAGVGTAAVTGFFCIRYFLRFIQTNSFLPFVIYRLVLAVVVLLFYLKNSPALAQLFFYP